MDLSVTLGDVRLARPVIAASGCLGNGRDGAGLVDLRTLGAIVSRTLTLEGTRGAATPRLALTPSGLLTAVGLQNPGVVDFVRQDLPVLAASRVPVIASIGGGSPDEFIRVAHELHDVAGVVALELYLPSPDLERGGAFAHRIERCIEVVGAVSRLSRYPIFAKLPMLEPDLVDTVHACVRAGAQGVTLIDGIPGLSVDTDTLRASLGAGPGYLSGPAMRPIALEAVRRVAAAMPNVPIMGVGGIATGLDAAEFILAGASAVQIGTALLVDPEAPRLIENGLVDYLGTKGIGRVADLRGRLRDGDDGIAGA